MTHPPTTRELVELARRYVRATGYTLVTVGRYAGNNGGFFQRLAAGGDITISKAQRVAQWFSNNWPNWAEWPPATTRPRPQARTKKPRRAREQTTRRAS